MLLRNVQQRIRCLVKVACIVLDCGSGAFGPSFHYDLGRVALNIDFMFSSSLYFFNLNCIVRLFCILVHS